MKPVPVVHNNPDESQDLYPGNAARNSSARAILAGRHADMPVVVAAVLLMATPVFGDAPAWPALAAGILGAAFAIPFMLRHGVPEGCP